MRAVFTVLIVSKRHSGPSHARLQQPAFCPKFSDRSSISIHIDDLNFDLAASFIDHRAQIVSGFLPQRLLELRCIYAGKAHLEHFTFGRSVGEIWTKSGLLQSRMVATGMAFAYDQYAKNCPNWDAVKSSEKGAMEFKLGVWRSPNFERPWAHRKSNR